MSSSNRKRKNTTNAQTQQSTKQYVLRGPVKNHACSDRTRQKYFNRKVMEEKAVERRTAIDDDAETFEERVLAYIATKEERDQITLLILSQIFHERMGIPVNDAMKHRSGVQRDSISGILGILQKKSESLSIGKKLRQNPVTGDIEWIFFNADKPEDHDTRLAKDAIYTGSMITRNDIRVANSKKEKRVRRRILKDEQKRMKERNDEKRPIF